MIYRSIMHGPTIKVMHVNDEWDDCDKFRKRKWMVMLKDRHCRIISEETAVKTCEVAQRGD
jgi:hypothetical protein